MVYSVNVAGEEHVEVQDENVAVSIKQNILVLSLIHQEKDVSLE